MKRVMVVLLSVVVALLSLASLYSYGEAYASVRPTHAATPYRMAIEVLDAVPQYTPPPQPQPTATAVPGAGTVHVLMIPDSGYATVTMSITAGDVMVSFLLVLCLSVLLFNTAIGLKHNV